jgi:hypothetical protein
MSSEFNNAIGEYYSKPLINGDIIYGCIFCGCDTNDKCRTTFDCGFSGEPERSDNNRKILKIISICTQSIDCDLGL